MNGEICFWNCVQGDPQSQDPVVYDNGVSYMFVQHSNIYLMTATRQNCNAASLIFFLHRIVDVSTIGFESFQLKICIFYFFGQ
jgi:AP-1 complex subunit mu